MCEHIHTCLVFLESVLPSPAGWASGQVYLPSDQVCLGPSWGRSQLCFVIRTHQECDALLRPLCRGGQAQASLSRCRWAPRAFEVFLAGTVWVTCSQVQLPSREGLGLFWPVQSLVMLTAQGEPKLATCPFLRTLWVLCAQCPGGALGTPPTPTIPQLILLHRWAS